MMGDVSETLESMRQNLTDRLSVQVAYGEPVTNGDVTVIPAAKVVLGFGAGAGVGDDGHRGNGGGGAGGGGGGGGVVQPMGFIEVSAAGARWVPQEPPPVETALRAVALAAILAPFGGRRFFLGRLLAFALVQFAIGRMFQPNLPPIPEGLRFGRMGQSAG
jgi:uncharacterized spore protein YtfJ